jgi:hypothetical protein
VLTLFYTIGLGIVVLHVMVNEPYRYGNLTIQEFSFKWVKVIGGDADSDKLNTCCTVPFAGQFFWITTFVIAFYQSNLSTAEKNNMHL